MSDRRRKALGIAMLGVSVLLTLMPAVLSSPAEPAFSFRALSPQPVRMPEIRMPQGTVPVNEANALELTELPGVGETTAALIVDERNRNGWFHYPEDLLSVRGIGEKKLAQMRELMDLSIKENESGE